MRARQRHQQGFSLIEILVAFMILAMSLTVIFRIFSSGTRNVALSEDYAQAVLVTEAGVPLVAHFHGYDASGLSGNPRGANIQGGVQLLQLSRDNRAHRWLRYFGW